MKTAAKKILSVVLALLMLIPTGIMSVFAQTEDASSADTETDVSYESTNAVGSMIAQELILAKGHTNTNGDNYCDVCGYDFALDCSHNCHSNNAFLKFFWQIALFFSKLFNIQSNRYCDCGVAHW